MNFAQTATARDTDDCVTALLTELLRPTSQSDKGRKVYQNVFPAWRKIKDFCLRRICSVVGFTGLANATLANAFTKSFLQLGWFTMKSTQRLSIAFSLLIVTLMSSGCASSCSPNAGTGLFGTNFLADRPVRTTFQRWFGGDSCDTCNTPAGQLTQPLVESCPTCVGGSGVQPFGGAQPLYDAPAINGQTSGFSGQFAPQPGPAVGSTSRTVTPIDGSTTRNFGNFGTGNVGSLSTPPSL